MSSFKVLTADQVTKFESIRKGPKGEGEGGGHQEGHGDHKKGGR